MVVVVVVVRGRGGAVSENSRVFQQCRQWGTKNTGSRELHSPESPLEVGVGVLVVATCAAVVVINIVRIRVIKSRSTSRSVSSVRIVANGRFHSRGG